MLAFNSHIPLRQSHPPQHSFLWISCRCSPFIMLKSILSIRTKFSPNDCHSCQHGHHCSVVWAQTRDAFSPRCFHSPRGRLHVPTGRLSSSLLAYNLAHTTEGELLGFLAPIPSLPQSLIRDHPANLPLCLKAKDSSIWSVRSPTCGLGLTSSFSCQSPPHGIVSARAFPSSPLGSIPSAHGQDQVSWTLKNRPWLLPTSACSDHPGCLFSLPQRSHRE